MHIDAVSIFPEMFGSLNYGVLGRALELNLLTFKCWNPRDYTSNKHLTVDDRPYGGGPGMVMQVEPLEKVLQAAKKNKLATTIYLSPQGKTLKQADIARLAQKPHLILLAGRYEGIDERVIEAEIDEEWSLGDYVLSGGEFAAMVLIDAIVRLLPGALGHSESAAQDSFSQGLLDYPHYTRPANYKDRWVPEVLLSGNHQAIEKWRFKQSLGRTWLRRPDLLDNYHWTDESRQLLDDFINEYNHR